MSVLLALRGSEPGKVRGKAGSIKALPRYQDDEGPSGA
jgi:hypothetical protein